MKEQITINPKIRFGKPVVKGTRITVEEVLGALAGGMDFGEIEKEYGITKPQVLAVLKYISGWIKGEKVANYEISFRR